jgi:hypothetical protein
MRLRGRASVRLDDVRSKKAVDLLRDPRVVVHSVRSDKDGTDGDVKIYGRAIDE